jgi:hypothetical protein
MPLELTSRQQTVMAEICSVMRALVYATNTEKVIDGAKLADDLFAIAERREMSPQDFDELYDRFHRSGANA